MRTVKGMRIGATLATIGISAVVAFALTGWSPTASMNSPRAAATITTLQNGSVLVAGGKAGLGSLPVLNSAELYNSTTGPWTPTGSMVTARQFATAMLLLDGRVLVAGGRTDTNISTATAEIYDPASGTWAITGAMSTTRVRHSAALLPNGHVLVAGGLDDTAKAGAKSS